MFVEKKTVPEIKKVTSTNDVIQTIITDLSENIHW